MTGDEMANRCGETGPPSGSPADLVGAYADLEDLYQRAAASIATASPLCEASGRCCRFVEYDHSLFVTDLEVHHLLRVEGPPRAVTADRCPYLDGNLCGARRGRPLGCRVYFCDPGWADRMTELAARSHREVQEIHSRRALPYRYGEFLERLGEALGR